MPKNTKLYYLKKGFELYNKGEYQKSINNYLKFIKLSPNDERGYNNIGFAYYAVKMYKEAIKSYKKAMKIKPNIFHTIYVLARLYFEQKQYKNALKYFEYCVSIKPNNLPLRLNLAYLYMKFEKYYKAVEILPKHRFSRFKKQYLHSLYTSLAKGYAKLKQFDKSIKFFKKAIDIKKDDIYSYLFLIEIYIIQKQPENIINIYKVMKNNFREVPKEISLFVESIHDAKNAFQKLERKLANLLISSPYSPKVQITFVKLHKLLQYFKEHTVYGEYKTIDILDVPSNIFQLLIEYYIRTNKVEQAIDVLKDALAKDTKNIYFCGLLVELYITSKKYEDAINVIKSCPPSLYNNIEIQLVLSSAYYHLGKKAEAIKIIKSYEKKNIKNVVIYNELGSIYYENNDYKNAEKYFSKSVKLKSSTYLSYVGLVKAYLKQKNVDINNIYKIYHEMLIYSRDISSSPIRWFLCIFSEYDKYEWALEVSDKELEYQKDDPNLYFWRAHLYSRLAERNVDISRWKYVILELANCKKLDPGYFNKVPLAYLYLTHAYSAKEDFIKAVNYAQNFLDKSKFNWLYFYKAHFVLAHSLYQLGNLKKAIINFQKALENIKLAKNIEKETLSELKKEAEVFLYMAQGFNYWNNGELEKSKIEFIKVIKACLPEYKQMPQTAKNLKELVTFEISYSRIYRCKTLKDLNNLVQILLNEINKIMNPILSKPMQPSGFLLAKYDCIYAIGLSLDAKSTLLTDYKSQKKRILNTQSGLIKLYPKLTRKAIDALYNFICEMRKYKDIEDINKEEEIKIIKILLPFHALIDIAFPNSLIAINSNVSYKDVLLSPNLESLRDEYNKFILNIKKVATTIMLNINNISSKKDDLVHDYQLSKLIYDLFYCLKGERVLDYKLSEKTRGVFEGFVVTREMEGVNALSNFINELKKYPNLEEIAPDEEKELLEILIPFHDLLRKASLNNIKDELKKTVLEGIKESGLDRIKEIFRVDYDEAKSTLEIKRLKLILNGKNMKHWDREEKTWKNRFPPMYIKLIAYLKKYKNRKVREEILFKELYNYAPDSEKAKTAWAEKEKLNCRGKLEKLATDLTKAFEKALGSKDMANMVFETPKMLKDPMNEYQFYYRLNVR